MKIRDENLFSEYVEWSSKSYKKWPMSEKFQTGGGQGHGISSGIEERACENSRGQLKKKQNFRRCLRKNCGISIGLGFWPWNFKGVSHNFVEFPEMKMISDDLWDDLCNF